MVGHRGGAQGRACSPYARWVLTIDTNVAVGLGIARGDFTHPQLTLLRGICQVHGIRLALTQTVIAEIVGRYERDLTQALQKLDEPTRPGTEAKREAARATVLRMVRLWTSRPEFFRGQDKEMPLLDWSLRKFSEQLARVFPGEPLPTPPGAADEGNRREIVRQLPAVQSGDGAGKGSRDTVIWLSVLAAANLLGYHRAYFIAKDKGFGDPLHEELQREAAQANAANLVFYADLDQLIDRLSTPAGPPEPIEDILAHDRVTGAVRRLLTDGNFRTEVADWVPRSNGWVFYSDNDQLSVEPRTDDTRTARIGEHTLVALNRIWRVRRVFPATPQEPEHEFEFTIQLAILVTYTNGVLVSAAVTSHGGIVEQPIPAAAE